MYDDDNVAVSLSFGYILGSIPFGFILVYLAKDQDIRTIGSGNIGATNVLRSGHKGLAFLTLILDALKGAIAFSLSVYGAARERSSCWIWAVVGHCFPIWLRFAGGKGVATGMSVITVIVPSAGLVMVTTWLIVAACTRISSLSALLSFVAAGLFASFGSFENPGMTQITVWGIGLLSWTRHKQNIQRIMNGEESKISFRKKPLD